MSRRSQRAEVVEATRKAVAQMLAQGRPTIQPTATLLNMNVRTLQRRLAAAGTSHSRIVDDVCFETACRLLGDPGRSVAEISSELGYSDPAHFTRAFIRRSGMTPRAYRQR